MTNCNNKLNFIVLFITIFFTAVFLRAQDIIITTNSEELQVKIEESGVTEVRFKLFGIEAGPILSKQKSDVFMITKLQQKIVNIKQKKNLSLNFVHYTKNFVHYTKKGKICFQKK